MKKALVGVSLLFTSCSLLSPQTAPQTQTPLLGIGFPGHPWTLTFDSPGFSVRKNEMQPDGRAYLLADNQATNTELSVFLEKVSGQATAEGCQENQKARLARDVP